MLEEHVTEDGRLVIKESLVAWAITKEETEDGETAFSPRPITPGFEIGSYRLETDEEVEKIIPAADGSMLVRSPVTGPNGEQIMNIGYDVPERPTPDWDELLTEATEEVGSLESIPADEYEL